MNVQNIDKIKEKEKIIQKCINESYQTLNKLGSSSTTWKNKFLIFKDYIKYNIMKLNTKCKFIDGFVHVLYKVYNVEEIKGQENYKQMLNKLLLMTYRSQYKQQTSLKNKSTYTSDCGWGCMIRSSQMIFSRIIYKIFKKLYKNKFTSDIIIKSVILFFLDNNININDNNFKYNDCIKLAFESYLNQLNLFLKKQASSNENKKLNIKSFDPPFSIHKICRIGEIYGRTCGEWFSDFELPKIYEIINTTFNIIPNLSILHFSSDLDINIIIEKCLRKIENLEDISNLPKSDYFTNENNENFIFNSMGAIFVSVRLGVTSIQPVYFPSLKKIFDCKQFLGLIGGKVYSGSYFFGYYKEDLLYLDPHLKQDSIVDLDDKNLETYTEKTVYQLPFKSLQCAFTLGFLFRDINEFRELYIFLKNYSLEKFPCFHINFKHKKPEKGLSSEDIFKNINDLDDDF